MGTRQQGLSVTYTPGETKTISTSVNTGTSFPSYSYVYIRDGYTGTLNRTSYVNNGRNEDQGYWDTKTEYKTASMSATQTGQGIKAPTYPASGGSRSYSDSSGYSGSLPLTSYNYDSWPDPNGGAFHFRRSWTWSGTVSRTGESLGSKPGMG